MAKLIVRPSQCAARVEHTSLGWIMSHCTVNSSVFLPCPSMFEFPDRCPLQDAISMQDHLDNVLALKRNKPNIQLVGKNKKRNRRNCLYYLSGTYSQNNCTHSDYQIPRSMVYAKCKGVKCGKYTKNGHNNNL